MNSNVISKQTRITSNDLTAQILRHIEQLAQDTDAARSSEEMKRYLDACSKFHQYSLNNIWLIMMQCPYATQVAGYRKWQSMNRFVRKGEQGIPILAPIVITKDPTSSKLEKYIVGFKVVFVFDISQTEGEPLPPPPDWKSPEKNSLLAARLIEFAETKGIVVAEKQLAGEIQGISCGGMINISPEAGTLTLVHEIAHELMHSNTNRPQDPSIREMEAESVAYVVGKYFTLEALTSPNYISLHSADSKLIITSLELIRNTSIEIINAIDEELISNKC